MYIHIFDFYNGKKGENGYYHTVGHTIDTPPNSRDFVGVSEDFSFLQNKSTKTFG